MDQVIFVRKVMIDCTSARARSPGDQRHRRVVKATLGDQFQCRLKNRFPFLHTRPYPSANSSRMNVHSNGTLEERCLSRGGDSYSTQTGWGPCFIPPPFAPTTR